jgi:transglutaminase-like putative cysteine protease
MSRKPGSGISPKDAETILGFLVFDSNRRTRTGALDPELVPFLKVSQEFSGVRRFPASKRDIRVEDATLRVTAEWDPRSDLMTLFPTADGQKLVKCTRREPHKGEIVLQTAPAAAGKAPPPPAAAGAALRKAVTEAVEAGAEPRERVEGILDWLDEKVARRYRAGDASAEQVIADPQGDATEFARLFVAMARASGIPSRPRVGLVARRTGFFFHAWAEVWLGHWVPVDPYLGQLPADLTHIRIATSGEDALSDWTAHRAAGLDRLQLRVVAPAEPKTAKQGG